MGVATADGLYAVLAVVGGRVLAPTIEPLSQVLRLLAAAVLLMLAVQVASAGLRAFAGAGPSCAEPEPLAPVRAYRRLVALTMVNPTTVVYFAALVAGDLGQTLTSPAQRLLFLVAAAGASASWQMLLVSGGALLGRAVTSKCGRLVTALSSGAIIAALALRNVVG